MSCDYYVTGSNGRLGTELQARMSDRDVYWATRQDADITDRLAVQESIQCHAPRMVIHLAAWTDVARAESHKEEVFQTNVMGTSHVARACRRMDIPLVFVSTDYVFGFTNRSPYSPMSSHDPVNYYGLSKSVAEDVVQSKLSKYLIVRTSFKPSRFPHSGACHDMYTSADYVDVIAEKFVEMLDNFPGYGVYHLGTERKSLLDLVRRRNPDIASISRKDVSTPLPEDTSFHPTNLFSPI